MQLSTLKIGVFSFLLVLLLMPFGHALMVLNELLLTHHKLIGAFLIGVLGIGLLIWGLIRNDKNTSATILGLLAGIFVWTGWIEFSFVWIAEKLKVPGLIEKGEVVTKPEYLIMMSSFGLLATFFIFFLFTQNRCTFFNWLQRMFSFRKTLKGNVLDYRPLALITFIETIMVLWTFYIVLLLVYDKDIAGDDHPATYFVAFGSLFWSAYLFLRLIKIPKFDYAIRYAIPTVIIFWNFVEVIGRWNLMKEIWVYPVEHWLENLMILMMLVIFIVVYIRENRGQGKSKNERLFEKELKEDPIKVS